MHRSRFGAREASGCYAVATREMDRYIIVDSAPSDVMLGREGGTGYSYKRSCQGSGSKIRI